MTRPGFTSPMVHLGSCALIYCALLQVGVAQAQQESSADSRPYPMLGFFLRAGAGIADCQGRYSVLGGVQHDIFQLGLAVDMTCWEFPDEEIFEGESMWLFNVGPSLSIVGPTVDISQEWYLRLGPRVALQAVTGRPALEAVELRRITVDGMSGTAELTAWLEFRPSGRTAGTVYGLGVSVGYMALNAQYDSAAAWRATSPDALGYVGIHFQLAHHLADDDARAGSSKEKEEGREAPPEAQPQLD